MEFDCLNLKVYDFGDYVEREYRYNEENESV